MSGPPGVLGRGDLSPRMVSPPPGPRARELAARLARAEAPGVNTVGTGTPPILWQEARGANVLDVDGNRYLDLTSGFGAAAVGHRHPGVTAAVRRQAGRLLHALGDVAAHPLRLELAERVAALAPVDDGRVFFGLSGSEAVEIALKTAALATGKPGVLAFDPAYHGLGLGALAVTSRHEFRTPFAAMLNPHVHRLPYGCSPRRVEEVLAAGGVGCLVVEPIAGREGVLVPPAGWLSRLAETCRRHRVLLAADEVLTGWGRTGRRFAVDEEGVRPDLLCCGKALAGGLPLSAVVGRRELMEAWRTGGEALHTATFLANPLACAAALAVVDAVEGDALAARAARLGRGVEDRLVGWAREHPAVRAVRGRGLLWGVEVAEPELAGRWTRAARRMGVLALAGGARGTVIQLLPPLTIRRHQLTSALDILERALEMAVEEAETGAGGGGD